MNRIPTDSEPNEIRSSPEHQDVIPHSSLVYCTHNHTHKHTHGCFLIPPTVRSPSLSLQTATSGRGGSRTGRSKGRDTRTPLITNDGCKADAHSYLTAPLQVCNYSRATPAAPTSPPLQKNPEESPQNLFTCQLVEREQHTAHN